MTAKQRLSRLFAAAVKTGKVGAAITIAASLLWLLAQVARDPVQLLMLIFLMLVGVWIVIYAAWCVAGQCDDEEDRR